MRMQRGASGKYMGLVIVNPHVNVDVVSVALVNVIE
jgi:hypothetical protein